MSRADAVLAHVDANLDAALERLFALLRIESISTDPAYRDACRAAADWLVEDLKGIGFDASRRDTPGHPMVVGHAGSGKHVLFYGHYDVQPVDPLDLWHRAPFDPAIEETARGTVIRGRGSSDDKGQLMTFVEAARAWVAVHGRLPARITLLFEGEEESGSPSLIPFLKANADELRAEMAMVCDTGMWDAETPAISTMLRGLAKEEFTITGPAMDLHSGGFGGAAINPIRVLNRILADLHDETGRVTLPGFYDGVEELSPELRQQWQGLGFDPDAFLGGVGLTTPAGERGYSALEMIWSRPTAEVNGIWGGYTGDGFKTVLPSQAHCKISFRLVGRQDPQKVLDSFRAHVRAGLPPDCKVEFHDAAGSPGIVLRTGRPEFAAARAALSAEWPREAAFIGCGGSIPIVGLFQDILGMDSLMIGYALDDDQIHSPNEKYDLRSFHKGIRSWVRVLDAISG